MKTPEQIRQEAALKSLKEFSDTETAFMQNINTAITMLQDAHFLTPSLIKMLESMQKLHDFGQSFAVFLSQISFDNPHLSDEELKARQLRLDQFFKEHASNILFAAQEYLNCISELETNEYINQAFVAFLKKKHPNIQSPMTLFVMPIQRITKYKTLIEEFLKNADARNALLLPSLEEANKWYAKANALESLNNVTSKLIKLKALNDKLQIKSIIGESEDKQLEQKSEKETQKRVEGLNALKEVASQTNALVIKLDRWLDEKGNDKPAIITFWKYLTPTEQQEFKTWIEAVYPPTRINNIEDFIKDNYDQEAKLVPLLQKAIEKVKQDNQKRLKETKTAEEKDALRTEINRSESFVRLLSLTSTQYLHKGSAKHEGGDNRDQYCIDASTRFSRASDHTGESEISLHRCNVLISALSTLESLYNKVASSDQEGFLEANLSLQREMGNGLVASFDTLCEQYPNDKDLADIASDFEKINENMPAAPISDETPHIFLKCSSTI